jgi:small subunit ribosomal protein S7
MSRRHRAEKRKIDPDPRYNSEVVAKFINKVMMQGKKSIARTIVYNALEQFASMIKTDDPLESFLEALENAKPSLEVKSRRIGGATYQVPVEISPGRRTSMAMKWIITFSRKKPGSSMQEALAQELANCYKREGSTIKKREDTHRMAEANKAFAHFKW